MSSLVSVTKDVLDSGSISVDDFRELKKAALDPMNPRDTVDADEQASIKVIYDAVQSGKVRTANNEDVDIAFELRNLIETKTYVEPRGFWSKWCYNGLLTEDLNGVTYISTSCFGNTQRYNIPYQSIESASAHQGALYDGVTVKVGGGEGSHNIDFWTIEDSGDAENISTEVNERIAEWNVRVNQGGSSSPQIQSVNAEKAGCEVGFSQGTGPDGRVYDIYTSPTCDVAMYPAAN